MGALATYEYGIVPHPEEGVIQASPDGCVRLREGVFHNFYSMLDGIVGLTEIKCPLYTAHMVRHVPCFPFVIPLDYAFQQQGQSSCCRVTWNDFNSCWRAGVKRPVVPLPRIPYQQNVKDFALGCECSHAHSDAAYIGHCPGGDIKWLLARALGRWCQRECTEVAETVVRHDGFAFCPDPDPFSDNLTCVYTPPRETARVHNVGEGLVRLTEEWGSSIVDVIAAYLGKEWYQPVAYLAGQMNITRHYHHRQMCEGMFAVANEHVQRVRDKIPPRVSTSNPLAYPEEPAFRPNRRTAGSRKRKVSTEREQKQYRKHLDDRLNHKLILVPMKRVEWVVHDTPECPPYNTLFHVMSEHWRHPSNLHYIGRGVLRDSFRQKYTAVGKAGVNWHSPVLPEHWPGKLHPDGTPLFYMTVFVTSYPNSKPLGSDEGIDPVLLYEDCNVD
jgi:hypothetical protein